MPETPPHDFDSAEPSSTPQPVTIDADGNRSSALDLGDVNEPSDSPRLTPHQVLLFTKGFQIKILLMLLVTIFALIAVDITYELLMHKSHDYLNSILSVLIPIFTFLLGIGAKPR